MRKVFNVSSWIGVVNGRIIVNVNGCDQEIMSTKIGKVDVENYIITTCCGNVYVLEQDPSIDKDLINLKYDVDCGSYSLRYLNSSQVSKDEKLLSVLN